MTIAILWPTLALVALIFAVLITMAVQRLGYIKRNPPAATDFASADSAARYYQPVARAGDNYVNLFEMPVLFFALVPLLLIFHHAGHVQVALAWIYVALRLVHSIIHIGPNKVPQRFAVFLVSCIVLAVMWVGFGIDMAGASAL
ncbi:MAPEG family protein [Glacieibacterium sp.]|uniref:MAPEG family protein n=1 Tax=Glacieibacterium sp. TaxID=2860237 RepID=UPI003AFF87EB